MENEREQAIHFFKKDEIKCVALMEQLLKSAENIFVLEKTSSENDEVSSDEKIFCALFFIKNTSTLFHYIPEQLISVLTGENGSEEKSAVTKVIEDFVSKINLFCIYGISSGTKFIESLVHQKIEKANDYFLMLHDKEKFLEIEKDFSDDKSSSKDRYLVKNKSKFVRQCTAEDADLLLQLERGYRQEEVAIHEHDESDAVVKYILNNSLLNQIVMALTEKNILSEKAISKAATNARGKEYCQIGGVYCHKDYRGKGNCFIVMFHLIKKIYESNKKPVLFVKEVNERAKHLYVQLGFYKVGNFRISYFEKKPAN